MGEAIFDAGADVIGRKIAGVIGKKANHMPGNSVQELAKLRYS